MRAALPRRASKRALVTGVAGSVGSALAELLQQKGWFVQGIDFRPPKHPNTPLFSFAGTDFAFSNALHLFEMPYHGIFHCAPLFEWEALPKKNQKEIEGTRTLLTCALQQKTPVLLFLSLYRKSEKLQRMAQRYLRYGLALTTLRLPFVLGAGVDDGLGDWLVQLNEHPLVLFPIVKRTKEESAPFFVAHLQDICEAALFVAAHSRAVGSSFDLIPEDSLTQAEFFHQTAAALKGHLVSLPLPLLPHFSPAISQAFRRGHPLRLASLLFSPIVPPPSSQPLKSLGFSFSRSHVPQVLHETLTWHAQKNSIPAHPRIS